MLNLDHHHPKDQNSSSRLLQSDWHKSHPLSIDSTDPSVLSVDPSHNHYSQPDLNRTTHTIDPVTPADAVDPIPAPANPSPETPGDLLSQPNDNESTSSLTPPPSVDNGRVGGTKESRTEGMDNTTADSHMRPSTSSGAPAANSRQSTPLTDLSNPNTPARTKEEEGVNHDGSLSNGADKEDKGEGSAGASTGGSEGERKESGASKTVESSMDGQTQLSGLSGVAGGSASGAALMDGAGDQLTTLGVSGPHKGPSEPPDEKAALLLDINTELLK